MKKFFQKQRETTIILVYIGIVVILAYFVVLPLIGRINSVKDQIQEEHVKQEIKQQQISELPKMEEQYNILKNNEKSIDVLLDKNDAVVLIEKLEKLAQESNNEISISVQNALTQKNTITATNNKTNTNDDIIKNLPSVDYLEMEITLTGNYNTIVKFVQSLESFEYYCDIVATQIKQKDENNKPAEIGTANPFNSGLSNNVDKISNFNNKNLEEAALDVVFYTKK